ncbi:hypothetical protein H9P43_001349 [Blastocladiella emersonii ATCC 22665]|nr:hypothetical protein H9P43_001349 [Blastocladiella emersonii ATCC 22665]
MEALSATGCKLGYHRFIYTIFRECVYTKADAAGVVFGYLSMGFWLFAQFPQVYSNYKKGSANSLAITFIAIWLVGDISNLVGSLLTQQLPFQIYLACYFVFVDILLFSQCLWYNYIKARLYPETMQTTEVTSPSRHRAASPVAANGARVPKHMVVAIAVLALLQPALAAGEVDTTTTAYKVGTVISYICTVMYLSSRFPQILLNYRRRSVEGLSPAMFAFALGGNATYAISVVLRSFSQDDQKAYLISSAPFIAGSAGVVMQDVVILIQWLMWRDRPTIVEISETTPLLVHHHPTMVATHGSMALAYSLDPSEASSGSTLVFSTPWGKNEMSSYAPKKPSRD